MIKDKNKITLRPLILMIFTAVYGFANMPKAFYLMGYGAIFWFIISAIIFFVPFAFMMAEFGAAFKDEEGGIYAWLNNSIGPKFAFVGMFMLYASNLIWLVNTSTNIWITLSNSVWGIDTTASWGIFGLNSTQTVGVLSILWIIIVNIIASKGISKITRVTTIGGFAVMALNIILILGAIIVLTLNGGHLAQPINDIRSLIVSPNPEYHSNLSMLSFLVFAIFGYGGIEIVSGLVDKTHKAEKTFPRAIAIAAIVISIGYSVGIFMCGIFIDWKLVLSSDNVNMANVPYVVMQNLGIEIAKALGFGLDAAINVGTAFARITGISMLLASSGAFFTVLYTPLKQMIQGTPKEFWPSKVSNIKEDMPKYAMWLQAGFMIVIVLVISFGGENGSEFFNILTLMTNVAITIPYMFITFAYAYFKNNDHIKKPFVFFKNKTSGIIASVIVTSTIGFANIFTIIEPVVKSNDLKSAIYMAIGPVLFTALSIIIYKRYEKSLDNCSCIA